MFSKAGLGLQNVGHLLLKEWPNFLLTGTFFVEQCKKLRLGLLELSSEVGKVSAESLVASRAVRRERTLGHYGIVLGPLRYRSSLECHLASFWLDRY
jgi:hypothetical protein